MFEALACETTTNLDLVGEYTTPKRVVSPEQIAPWDWPVYQDYRGDHVAMVDVPERFGVVVWNLEADGFVVHTDEALDEIDLTEWAYACSELPADEVEAVFRRHSHKPFQGPHQPIWTGHVDVSDDEIPF